MPTQGEQMIGMTPHARRVAVVALCMASAVWPLAGRADTGSAINTQGSTARTVATFAGGCFWCMEPPFDALPGVLSTTSGYIGGRTKNPTYEQVSEGGTGHIEAIQVAYDPAKVSYEQLLDVYWRNVDPLDGGGQFCDRGPQYRPAIFYHSADQQQLAEAAKQQVTQRFGKPIAVEIIAADTFYAAEDYHQDYYKKNPVRYNYYKWSCGREQRLDKVWGTKK
jgi:peptide-methionine (S)-S-oxide reductase